MDTLRVMGIGEGEHGPWTWPRALSPRIDRRRVLRDLGGDETDHSYAPFDFANLPNVLAKVTTPTRALRFAELYGLLGYSALLGADIVADEDYMDATSLRMARHDELNGGEPIEWVLAQAGALRFALELLAALRGQGAAPAEVLARHRIDEEDQGPAYPTVLRFTPTAITLHADAAPEDIARWLVLYMAEKNAKGVRDALRAQRGAQTGFDRLLQADALIEVIWWHLEQWAVEGQLRLCELETCRTPFLVTDQRQRFCPGLTTFDPKTGEARTSRSRCAGLHQKRRQLQRGE